MRSAISSTRVPESVLTMPMVGAVPPRRRTASPGSVTRARQGPGSPRRGGLLSRCPRVGVQVVQRRAQLGVGDLLGRLPGGLRREAAHDLDGARVGVPEVAAEILLPELLRGPLAGNDEVRLDATFLDAAAL